MNETLPFSKAQSFRRYLEHNDLEHTVEVDTAYDIGGTLYTRVEITVEDHRTIGHNWLRVSWLKRNGAAAAARSHNYGYFAGKSFKNVSYNELRATAYVIGADLGKGN